MNLARLAVAVVGILLPYIARIPGGAAWVEQYTDVGVVGFLFFGAFNAIPWGSIVGFSFLFRRPGPLLIPCVLGFGFLGWAHYNVDLASDAQASLLLLVVPILAMVPIVVGGVLGYVLDRRLRRHDKPA